MAETTQYLVERYFHLHNERRLLRSKIATDTGYFSDFGKSDGSTLAVDVHKDSIKKMDELFANKEKLVSIEIEIDDIEQQLIPRLEVLHSKTITNVIIDNNNNPIFYYLELRDGKITLRLNR